MTSNVESHRILEIARASDELPSDSKSSAALWNLSSWWGCRDSGGSSAQTFELGHLYPPDSASELVELSPICLGTERWYSADEAAESKKEIHGSLDSAFTAALDENGDDCHGPANSSSPSKKSKCTCLFGHGTSTLYVGQATAASSLAAVITARCASMAHQNYCNIRVVPAGLVVAPRWIVSLGPIIPLTCCGNGTWPGQGEGSAAEVTVFGGCLDLADIQHLEQRAMRR
jgi:hypothetical protein